MLSEITMASTPSVSTKLVSTGLSLVDLPDEILLMITSHLIYPDALSLKHSNRHFYNIVYTGVNLKIEWLIARRQLHLECPHDGPCILNTDRDFCRGSIRLLMARRRQHVECQTMEGGRGCLVFGTSICEYRQTRSWRVRLQHLVEVHLRMLVCICMGIMSVAWMCFFSSSASS
jgi:hypothetical protein